MKQDLPTLADLFRKKSRPVAWAIKGALKSFTNPGSEENDSMHFVVEVNPLRLASENVNQTARKIQFITKLELSQPINGE